MCFGPTFMLFLVTQFLSFFTIYHKMTYSQCPAHTDPFNYNLIQLRSHLLKNVCDI